ncbi:restriction endonuclease subunit S [Vibrio parahaemolyticus]|nr:restriction endonuclease subunit S [Vibrio parahaemolyticus]
MNFDLVTYELGELGSLKNGANFNKNDAGDGCPVMSVKQLFRGRFVDTEGLGSIKLGTLKKLDDYLVKKNDLLFARSSLKAEGSGQVAIVNEYPQNCIFSGFTIRFRVFDESKVNPLYLYYLLRSPKYREIFVRITTGSVISNLTQATLSKIPVELPNKETQDYVANIFDELDRKRELGAATNQTLEQLAQAIFKSWFVDFDPVKAKMNGEQPEGMDAATASLFPDKLDSETGIPVGWSQGIIADIAKLNAKSWTKKNQPEQVHYVDLANTKNGVIETVTTYDFEEAPSRARRVLNYGDTIVGTVRPGNRSFAFIGETEQPLTGSTGFAVLSPKKEFWTSFVYLATTNDDAIDEYARLADGGAYPAIKPVVVADTPCVIPTTDIAQKFWQLTGAMLKKAHQNRLENEELAQLRNTLLPKLLSGEIELGQAQELAEVE